MKSDPWYVEARVDGEPVARVELDDAVTIDHYAGTP